MFENRVLRRIFGPKMDEVTGEWRKFHNEELHNLCYSANINYSNQIKHNEIRRTCTTHGTDEGIRILVRKLLWRSRCS
jgi:hypothetical protein